MHRIDSSTKDVDLFGSGKHGFTEGTPGTEAATRVTDDWLNDVQEEIANTVEDAGIALVKGTQTQLRDAVRAYAEGVSVPKTLLASDLMPDNAAGVANWTLDADNAKWTSRANNGKLLGHIRLPTDLSTHTVNVIASVDPGAARGAGNRMELRIYKYTISTSGTTALYIQEDDGTANPQNIEINAVITSDPDYAYSVVLEAGNTGAASPDTCFHITVELENYPT